MGFALPSHVFGHLALFVVRAVVVADVAVVAVVVVAVTVKSTAARGLQMQICGARMYWNFDLSIDAEWAPNVFPSDADAVGLGLGVRVRVEVCCSFDFCGESKSFVRFALRERRTQS